MADEKEETMLFVVVLLNGEVERHPFGILHIVLEDRSCGTCFWRFEHLSVNETPVYEGRVGGLGLHGRTT